MTRLGRLFFTYHWVQAAVISLAAVSISALLGSLAPAAFTTFDHGWYDLWSRTPHAADFRSPLLVAVRDTRSEELFGEGPWDRADIARLVSALHEAGARAIGIDVPLAIPSPPTQGGAASDALLLEAVSSAGSVVYRDAGLSGADSVTASTLFPSGLARPASAHFAVTVDPDRVVRRIPLFVETGGRTIPAFALQLAASFWRVLPQDIARLPGEVVLRHADFVDRPAGALHIPTDGAHNLFIHFSGREAAEDTQRVSIAELSPYLKRNPPEQLIRRIQGHVIVLLTHPTSGQRYPTTVGFDLPDDIIQLQALRTILSGQWIRELPAGAKLIIPILLCAMVGWFVLAKPAPLGVTFAIAGLAFYGAFAFAILAAQHWILPFAVPMTAGALTIFGSTLLEHMLSTRKTALIEADTLRIQWELKSVREALVRRENTVEALEEDLDSARLAAMSSADRQDELLRTTEALRLHVAEAQRLEETARRRVEALEEELRAARAACPPRPRLGNAELEQLQQECERLGILTRDPGLLSVFRDLKKGAASDVTVLITGEAGTGKELFARAVHQLSPRKAKPFIAINMAAVSAELFESELFGHVRGSFTGALSERKGYLELAHQGTIFLDEVGDLRLDHQSKLLRVLQDRTFYRVGATHPTTVDVRIVAATNKDLQRGVSEGWFREDLYFRLKGLVLRLPPLRERAEDIPLLAQSCLEEASGQNQQSRLSLSEEALAALMQHPWKGNVRELRHCLEQAVVLCDGSLIRVEDLRLDVTITSPASPGDSELLLPDPAGDSAVLALLRQHLFDMQITAKVLGWDRSTVTQRLKGLCFQALVETDGDQTKAAVAVAGDPSLSRTVELKIMDYYGHLLEKIQPFSTPEAALADCKRRFKNLPERHFKFVETLVRKHFEKAGTSTVPTTE